MSIIVCAYCRRPLERLSSVESEAGEDLHVKTEYMCTNTRCDYSSRVIYESKQPFRKQGYITVHMLNNKVPPKNWLRKLFEERVGQLSFRS